jgi:hypothetical protein
MKKIICVFLLLAGASSLASEFSIMSSPLEFAAPVLGDKTALTNAQAGQIVFDMSTGQFYGLTTSGAASTAGNWTPLSASTGNSTVISTAALRVEYAIVSLCNSGTTCTSNVTSNSGPTIGTTGSWLGSIGRDGAGVYILNFSAGIFSGTPVCTFVGSATQNALATIGGTTSSTQWTVEIINSTIGTSVDTAYMVTCVGPK